MKKRLLSILLLSLVGVLLFSACKTEETWPGELECRIKKAYDKTLHDETYDDADFKIEDVSMAYFGSYSGYEAVLYTGAGSAMIRPIEVGGHLFKFGTANVILLYKDGTFTDFHKVFQAGGITQEDLDRLYEAYIDELYMNRPA